MADQASQDALQFPVETDILIRPDGSVVVADLPAELSELMALLAGVTEEDPVPQTRDQAPRTD